MKRTTIFAVQLCLLCEALLCQPARSAAQLFAQDNANGYSGAAGNAAWLYGSTTNGGFGFTPWIFRKTGPGFQGFYVGNGGSIATTNNGSWGMYANQMPTNLAVAFRGFSNSLPVNATFRIKWQTHGIGTSDYKFAGFSLRTGNATSSIYDYTNGERFAFFYRGGGQNNATIRDGNGESPAPYPGVTYDHLAAGASVEVILLAPDTYRLAVKDATGANTIAVFDGYPLAGTGPIQSVALYASQTDADQNFNSMEIASVSLLPPQIANVQPVNNSIYVAAAATQIAFDVSSDFSTISVNAIKLALNGVNVTDLSFSGSAAAWSVLALPALADNTVYAGVITAQDANGNRATNNFTFNTWRSDDPFIEAEDYNHGAGAFLADAFPDAFNQYFGLPGTNGVDYLKSSAAPTNQYRADDWTGIEVSGDVDHAGYANSGYANYNLGWIDPGEWVNYTRTMSNATYAVYARMASLSVNPVMRMERLANSTAANSNQLRAALGTFVCPTNAGGEQSYAFVPLLDLFNDPVFVRFPGTNTFRATRIGGGYNFDYLIFVPSTVTNTLRPYLAVGAPLPGASRVLPDQRISFAIANRQTAVAPGTIQVFLNNSNVTGGLVRSNNSAGTDATYQPPTLLPSGTNTLLVTFSDSASVSVTNRWQFNVATLPALPPAFALSPGLAGEPGFAIRINKATNNAPAYLFPATLARAEQQLANGIINTNTGLPFPNEAAGPNGDGGYSEANSVNYDIAGLPTGSYTFATKTPFPYVPASSPNNFIAMSAETYVLLPKGVYSFVVRSDDGFQLTAGPTPGNTNYVVGLFDGGRGNGTPTTMDFIVQTEGLYPMRLLYDQGQFGGNIEFYSINHVTGEPILVNDLVNPGAVRTFRTVATPVVILNPAHNGTSTAFSFLAQSGKLYSAQFKITLNDTLWQTFKTLAGTGTLTNILDSTATNATRYYRIVQQ